MPKFVLKLDICSLSNNHIQQSAVAKTYWSNMRVSLIFPRQQSFITYRNVYIIVLLWTNLLCLLSEMHRKGAYKRGTWRYKIRYMTPWGANVSGKLPANVTSLRDQNFTTLFRIINFTYAISLSKNSQTNVPLIIC